MSKQELLTKLEEAIEMFRNVGIDTRERILAINERKYSEDKSEHLVKFAKKYGMKALFYPLEDNCSFAIIPLDKEMKE